MDSNSTASQLGIGGQPQRIVVLTNPTSTTGGQTRQLMTMSSAVASHRVGQFMTIPSTTVNRQASQLVTIPNATSNGQAAQLVTIPSVVPNFQVGSATQAVSSQPIIIRTDMAAAGMQTVNTGNQVVQMPTAVATRHVVMPVTIGNSCNPTTVRAETTTGTPALVRDQVSSQVRMAPLTKGSTSAQPMVISNPSSARTPLGTSNARTQLRTRSTGSQPIVSSITVSSAQTLPLNNGQVGGTIAKANASTVATKSGQSAWPVTTNGQLEIGHRPTALTSDVQAAIADMVSEMGASTSAACEQDTPIGLPVTSDFGAASGTCISCEQLQKVSTLCTARFLMKLLV